MAEREFTVAVVGATGAVGSEVLKTLEERVFPVGELRLFASQRTAGELVEWRDGSVRVELLDGDGFDGVDIAFFCAGGAVSAEYAPRAVDAGAIVIDKSSHFRMHPDVPLVVPEVNAADLDERHLGIIASPNCTTIPIVVALKPIADAVGLARIVASSYQAVSGGGKRGVDALSRETINILNMRDFSEGEGEEPSVFPRRIAFNCIPAGRCIPRGRIDEGRGEGDRRDSARPAPRDVAHRRHLRPGADVLRTQRRPHRRARAAARRGRRPGSSSAKLQG